MRSSIFAAVFISLCLTTVSTFAQDGPAAGQKVAFMGDSITQFGESPVGYVSLVASALEKNGRKIIVIPAGVSGNTSKDMLARLDRDVLSKKPDWMTLSCGVNDVWHGANGVDLPTYKTNITSIVDQATKAGIKVVILTATMITEDQTAPNNVKLVPYNDFLRSLAAERHFPVADLNADMQAALAAEKAKTPNIKGSILTVDGVHMNGLGNEMMASGVLKAFGLTDAQIAEQKEAWMDLAKSTPIKLQADVTVRQYLQLRDLAAAQGKSVEQMAADDLTQLELSKVTAAPAAPSASPAASTNAAPAP
jgi:lysophospholipase L1-like esterase